MSSQFLLPKLLAGSVFLSKCVCETEIALYFKNSKIQGGHGANFILQIVIKRNLIFHEIYFHRFGMQNYFA